MSPIALLLALVCMPQEKDPENAKITLDLHNVTVQEVLDHITKTTKIPIELDDAARKKLDPEAKISLKVQDINVKGALQLLLGPQGFSVKLVDKKKFVVTVSE